jgi:hypothetical protein
MRSVGLPKRSGEFHRAPSTNPEIAATMTARMFTDSTVTVMIILLWIIPRWGHGAQHVVERLVVRPRHTRRSSRKTLKRRTPGVDKVQAIMPLQNIGVAADR